MLSSVPVYGRYNVLPGFPYVYGVFSGLLVHPGIRFSSGSPPAPEFSRKNVSWNTHSKQQTSLPHTKTQALQPIKTALQLARGLQEGFFPPCPTSTDTQVSPLLCSEGRNPYLSTSASSLTYSFLSRKMSLQTWPSPPRKGFDLHFSNSQVTRKDSRTEVESLPSNISSASFGHGSLQ